MRDLWRPGGDLTYRRVRVLLDTLPPQSRTKTAMRERLGDQVSAPEPGADPGHGAWSHLEMLVAELIDANRMVEHAVYRSQGGKGSPPARYPRPGVKAKRPTSTVLTPTGITQLSALRDARRGVVSDD